MQKHQLKNFVSEQSFNKYLDDQLQLNSDLIFIIDKCMNTSKLHKTILLLNNALSIHINVDDIDILQYQALKDIKIFPTFLCFTNGKLDKVIEGYVG